MKRPSPIPVALIVLLFVAGAAPRPSTTPYEAATPPARSTAIDDVVLAKLRQLGIPAARPCSDAVFARRVYLDVIGTLPTAQEARDFLADRTPNKRRILIDRLLERGEFADYWAMKWADLLRVKAEFPINLWPNAVQAYHRWIYTAIDENWSYDRFARELLTASGSNFRAPPVNFYRAVQSREPQALAQTVALTFMGCRAELWPKERLAGMAVFFSQIGYKPTGEWKEEIVYFDQSKPATRPATGGLVASFPDGTTVGLSPDRDPREDFADWLISPKNPWFASISNRVWAWLLGRGIVHEPDDIRPDNPPVNAEVLALLERELIASHYDLKHLYRLILNSQTYQRSCIPASSNAAAEANFAHYGMRRLEAEVLIDAICQITGTNEKYSSPIPEPFTFIPERERSIALADGSTTSSFLEMFGRPARDTGMELERNNRPTASQRLHLLNSSHIQRKLEQSTKIRNLTQGRRTQQQSINELYLMILSRNPTAEEMQTALAYAGTSSTASRQAVVDLAWALINSAEFLYRH